MGHTKPENLRDLKAELAEIRALPQLKEKSPGVFYFKALPFLHFHDKNGVRWVDLREGCGWKKVEVAFSPSASARSKLLKAAKAAHKKLAMKGKK